MKKLIALKPVKRTPTYEEVRKKRLAYNLTQKQAAEYIYSNIRAWESYEGNIRRMPMAKWELFLIKCEFYGKQPKRK